MTINETKIIDFIQKELKCARYEIHPESKQIIIYSSISNVKRLIDFVEPLNYYVSYVCKAIFVNPRS